MKRMPSLLVVSWAWALSAAAQTPSTFEKEVRAVEEQRYKAMLQNDFPTLEKLMADDVVYVHSSGAVDDKQSFVATLRSGSLRYKKFSPEDTRVRIAGNLAVVTGNSAVEVDRDGKPQSFRVRFTAVYEKSGAGWRLSAWQTTRLPGN